MMKLLAVTGRPILHSLSPNLFEDFFRRVSLPNVYLRLAADSSEEVLQLCGEIGITGLNVTSPFKEGIVDLLDSLDASAKAVGAVNTVLFSQGKSIGCNTDPVGASALIAEAGGVAAKDVIAVLGAGGAARAVLHVLTKLGNEHVLLVNRSCARGAVLANRFGYESVSWSQAERRLSQADLVICCLPGGVRIRANGLHFPQRVLDATYHNSAILQAAEKLDCRTHNGWTWLVAQAKESFRLMTGMDLQLESFPPPDRKMATDVPIILTGLPGVGKTIVGKHLAQLLGREFIDTDRLIENRVGKTVADIFLDDGEAGFRRLERRAVVEALAQKESVVSLGGGALLDSKTLVLVKSTGIVVWLWATPNQCAERVSGEGRPLLRERKTVPRLAEMLLRRKPAYASASDLVIGTSGRTPEEVAQRISNENDSIRSD